MEGLGRWSDTKAPWKPHPRVLKSTAIIPVIWILQIEAPVYGVCKDPRSDGALIKFLLRPRFVPAIGATTPRGRR